MLLFAWFSDFWLPLGICFVLGAATHLLLNGLHFVGLRYFADPFWQLVYPRPDDALDNTVLLNLPWFRFGLVYFVFYGLIWSGWFNWVLLAAILYGGYRLYRRYGQKEPDRVGEPAEGFVFRTQGGPLHLANPYRGILIVGGAGSGKSKSLIEPLIQQAGTKGMAGIVYDFKFPVLAQEVAGSYADSGVTPYFVNFTDLSRSHRVNPLRADLLTNVSFAREAAVTILANLDYKASQARSFWIQSAEVLLTGAIWYLRQRHPQYCTLPHAVSLLLEGRPQTLIQTLSGEEQTRGLIASISSGAESENQLAGVFATIQNYLAVLNSPEIFWVLSGDDVPLELNHPQKPSVLIVGNDPSLSDTLSPLVSLIISTALKRMNQPQRVPSVVILDEAPTLFIPNFQQIPATARSNQIATVYAVQDVAQVEGSLGAAVSEMILSNLSNQFFGRTTNPKTAQRVAQLFGKYDQAYQSRSVTRGENQTSYGRNESIQQRDRLAAADVMRFQPGEFAGLIAEGNILEFRALFYAESSQAQVIEPFGAVNTPQLTTHFRQIQTEARQILDWPLEKLPGNRPTGPTLDDFL